MSQEIKIIKNRYVLLPDPKAGGMSLVYGANDIRDNGRRVALKIFQKGNLEEKFLLESYNRETRALQELKHPNIVGLLDFGIDEETKHPFIVMEWMDQNLSEWKDKFPLEEWDSFYNQIGRPILEALDYAHSNDYIHRDMKTKNILVDQNGLPKLADFGIAKLRRILLQGVTLFDFKTPPFTPPGDEDNANTFTRDVYGFGVTVLDCLTDVNLVEREDVEKALFKLEGKAPSEVCQIITQAVSADRAERQQTAGIILAQFRAVQEQRLAQNQVKKYCFIQINQNSIRTLQRLLREDSQDSIRKLLLEDLNTVCGIRSRLPQDKGSNEKPSASEEYNLFGAQYSYIAKVDDRGEGYLFIIQASPSYQIFMEKHRESAWLCPYEFRVGKPSNSYEADFVLDTLRLEVNRHEAALRAADIAKQEERLFQTWHSILRAKNDIEKNRKAPITYNSFNDEGARITFHITQMPDEDISGQIWRIKLVGGGVLSGEIEAIRGNKLALLLNYGDAYLLPESGQLEFDTHAADVALERQRNALDSIRFNRAIRPDLRRLIINPEQAQIPNIFKNIEFIQDNIDDSKKAAVQAGLGINDFLVVQGPPGTGKTTFISEIILQTLREYPDARILLTSQTHVALDNAIERIRKHVSDLKIVRIGPSRVDGESPVSTEVMPLLIENLMQQWREDALAKGQEFLTQYAIEKDIPQNNVKIAMALEQLSQINSLIRDKDKLISELEQEKRNILSSTAIDSNQKLVSGEQESDRLLDIESEISRVKSERKIYRQKKYSTENELKTLVDPDEAEELFSMSPEQLADWSTTYLMDKPETREFKRLTSIYVEWKERFGLGSEFRPALLVSAQVIAGTCLGVAGVKGAQDIEYDLCIVDEASKATPTEVLVPLSKSRRWILVGDQKQLPPFIDDELRDKGELAKYGLRRDDLKRTLFDHLIERLPSDCRTKLVLQHRMVAPIGNLISECFYDGELKSAEKPLDIDLIEIFKRPVTWFSTAKLHNRRESRIGASYINRSEVAYIQKLLKRIDLIAKASNRQYSVAVLTGYAGQKQELDRIFASQRWDAISVVCNTVDAFQGREADIALYSITRANDEDRIGFLSAEERINVALSRGRYYLGIVGDHNFCRWSSHTSAIKKVVRYIDDHREDCCIVEEEQL